MKLLLVSILLAALLQPTKANGDVVTVVDAVNASSAPTNSPTIHPLKGTPLPKKCENEINEGRSLSKFCTEWLEVNDDFIMPTHFPSEAPSAAPSPFFNIKSSTLISENDRVSLVFDISPVDDTFIELFRPDISLGDKSNLKIDAVEDAPTKVTMLKFNLGEAMNQALSDENLGVSLKSAKLHLHAKNTATTDQFGGYIEEIDTNWSEETTAWRDYIKGGPGQKKRAEKLLPSANDTLASIEAVSRSQWAEADITERFQEIAADWSITPVPQFSVRITTDKSEGVVYASKENIQFGPKLSLVFEFDGTSSEVAAAASKVTPNPTNAPTAVPSPPPTPTSSPVLSAASLNIQTDSPVATTSSPSVTLPPSTLSPVVNTPLPTSTPSRAPSSLPTPLPTAAEVTKEPPSTSANTVTTATSVVSQMFQLKIEATTDEVHERKFKDRQLGPLMSPNAKERPALEEHLMNVYADRLTSSPERVEVAFVNDNMEVEVVGNNKIVRSNAFKIIGKIDLVPFQKQVECLISYPSCSLLISVAIFMDPRIATISANEASKVLDRATLHAFTGAENTAFVSILKKTGDPIISNSEKITVDVSKMSFSIGNVPDQSIQAASATEPGTSANASNESSEDAGWGWAGPALVGAASLVVIASALASFILIRQRRSNYSYDEEHKNANKPTSPTNTEAVTPSPTSFGGRFQKKNFGYTEFDDPEDLSTKQLEYDFRPIAQKEEPEDLNCPSNVKFSHFQSRSFDDSTVSNVSAHIYGGLVKSPERNESDKSGIESQFQFDNLLGNDNDLQVDGIEPSFLVDDDSASAGDVPSELYNVSMDESQTTQSHDLSAVYAATAFMNKAKDSFMAMPPPPSDAASETSSQSDLPQPDNDEISEGYQKSINDELNKVMMILNQPATEDDKMENGDDDNSEGSDPISNIYDVPYLQSASKGAHTDGSVQSSVLSEDDPVKLMNEALDDCMKILDKARPNDDVV
eukprot:scaffold29495_cov211-Skeletonema_menzelii.AAC.2